MRPAALQWGLFLIDLCVRFSLFANHCVSGDVAVSNFLPSPPLSTFLRLLRLTHARPFPSDVTAHQPHNLASAFLRELLTRYPLQFLCKLAYVRERMCAL